MTSSAKKKLALVTGATGFVGSAVARALLKSGRELRLLVRSGTDQRLIQELHAELMLGDLRDPASLKRAVRGCDEVYHVAAQYSFFNPNPQLIYQSNVQGTSNLLQAALEANVGRFIYTSTVGTVGIPGNGGSGNEETPLSLLDCKGHYKRSKFLAEQEALSFYRKGLPLVIVNPSAPIGARDIKPTPTGRMIVDFLNRKMPAYMDTGLNIVDVDDVALGHLLAAEKGRLGERYILGHQNLSLKEILEALAQITGLKAPRVKVPYRLALGAAHCSEVWARAFKTQPLIEVEAVQLGRKKMFFDANKAVRELGLPQTPARTALAKAVAWYLENGYVRHQKSQQVLRLMKHPNF